MGWYPPPATVVTVACIALTCGSGCDTGATVPAPGPRGAGSPDAGTMAATEDAGEFERPPQPALPMADSDIQLPFRGQATHTFTVAADLGRLDVHFSVDTTGSIASEIDQLQASLDSTVARRVRARVPDVAFGVSRFEDFPLAPFGAGPEAESGRPDTPFGLLTPVTSDRGRLSQALAALDSPLGEGGDGPEAGAEALYQIATGEGIELDGEPLIAPFDADQQQADGALGGVGFRTGALPVIVHVTDATSHAEEAASRPHEHSLADAIEALQAINARVIGIASGACPSCPPPTDASRARAHLQRVAHATGSVQAAEPRGCPMGIGGRHIEPYQGSCPLVYEVDEAGNGLPQAIAGAVVALLDGVRFGVVEARTSADPLGLVEALEVRVRGGDGARTEDRDPQGAPDGLPDTALEVGNRAELEYRVHLRNDVVAPSDREQTFRVIVTVSGDGLLLAEEVIRVRVPAAPPDAGLSWTDDDAGRDSP